MEEVDKLIEVTASCIAKKIQKEEKFTPDEVKALAELIVARASYNMTKRCYVSGHSHIKRDKGQQDIFDKASPSYESRVVGDVANCNSDDIVSEHMEILKKLIESSGG